MRTFCFPTKPVISGAAAVVGVKEGKGPQARWFDKILQEDYYGEKTFEKARKLSRLVKKSLQDYTGDMNGVEIQAVFIKSDYELNGNTSLKFDTEEYMSCIEFEIHYNEK